MGSEMCIRDRDESLRTTSALGRTTEDVARGVGKAAGSIGRTMGVAGGALGATGASPVDSFARFALCSIPSCISIANQQFRGIIRVPFVSPGELWPSVHVDK